MQINESYCRVIYNDGSSVEPLNEHYANLKRSDMKSVTVVKDGKPVYTLPIKNNKLVYRTRVVAKGLTGDFTNAKRIIILATEGKVAFIFPDGEIVEQKKWGKEEPFTQPNLRDDEK